MTIDINDPFAGITECAIHARSMDEDCEYCKAEFDAKNKISEHFATLAQAGIKDLMMAGVRMPDGMVLGIRLELLIESILQDRMRLHFEVEAGRRLVGMINEAKKDVTRAKLTGHPASKGLQVVTGGGLPKRPREKWPPR